MAEGLNKVILLGNLGADPELRMTNGGTGVLSLRLATSESYLDRNRVRQERTEWHSVVVWGKRGEALAKFLKKGARILVEGSLRTSSYEDREGTKRYKTEIVAHNVVLAGTTRKKKDDDDDAPSSERGSSRKSREDSGTGSYDDTDYGGGDDDIPF